MKSLICPVSPLRIDRNVARLTALTMALLIMLYLFTGAIVIMMVVAVDYFIRAFTPMKYSAASWLATQFASMLHLSSQPIDKAPKIFAARVGFLVAFTSVVLLFISPTASIIVASILMGFALLESVFDLCVGCIVYTYVVFPIFKGAQ